ncbi:MAG TPA: hypothetical protein VMM38_00580 [Aridibacter sp.]|nr:hypothetical protein [Aridibacter sp.]
MRQRKLRQYERALLPAILFLLALTVFPQELPDKIRGYKVHKAEVGSVSVSGSEGDGTVFEMSFGDPEFDSVGLTGVTLTVDPVLTVTGKSGRVDFLSFRDFEVNGIPVEIEDYESSFSFRSGEMVALEEPVRIVVGLSSAVRGAAKEIKKSEEEWQVTGTVFVFGRFKWSIFKFKRVVPLPVSFTIPNPLTDRPDS